MMNKIKLLLLMMIILLPVKILAESSGADSFKQPFHVKSQTKSWFDITPVFDFTGNLNKSLEDRKRAVWVLDKRSLSIKNGWLWQPKIIIAREDNFIYELPEQDDNCIVGRIYVGEEYPMVEEIKSARGNWYKIKVPPENLVPANKDFNEWVKHPQKEEYDPYYGKRYDANQVIKNAVDKYKIKTKKNANPD